ncbi:MAG TPA: type IV pilus modification protein PilV, partial [Pseudomonadales bacterium]|nr:type IV pilus modification protein PilV [Pseudomonadales bacterium]
MKLISTINAQKGSSMIEVLVSMIILLVGILGIASLQTRGITNSKGSYYRTQAAIFAEDIFDRMRANRDGSTTSA